MVIGFEHLTAQLSAEEEAIAVLLSERLVKCKGQNMAMDNRAIRDYLQRKDCYVSAVRVRKIINHIRINSMVSNLVASSRGYYIAENQEELDRYVTSLRQRASAILLVAQSYY